MAIQFPASPTNGQVYQGYYYDSNISAWKASPVSAGPVAIADVAPTGAIHGDMWYNSFDGSSYVYVNDGTSSQWVEVHSNTAALPGSVIQVVQGVLADTVAFTTQNSWTSVGLSATITPKLPTSKILVSLHIGIGVNGSSNSYDAAFGLFRNNTQIALPNGPYGNRTPSIAPFGDRVFGTNEMTTVSNQYLDSPATVSSLTYDVKAFSTNAFTHFINRTGADADQSYDNRMISTVTLMEVAQ